MQIKLMGPLTQGGHVWGSDEGGPQKPSTPPPLPSALSLHWSQRALVASLDWPPATTPPASGLTSSLNSPCWCPEPAWQSPLTLSRVLVWAPSLAAKILSEGTVPSPSITSAPSPEQCLTHHRNVVIRVGRVNKCSLRNDDEVFQVIAFCSMVRIIKLPVACATPNNTLDHINMILVASGFLFLLWAMGFATCFQHSDFETWTVSPMFMIFSHYLYSKGDDTYVTLSTSSWLTVWALLCSTPPQTPTSNPLFPLTCP